MALQPQPRAAHRGPAPAPAPASPLRPWHWWHHRQATQLARRGPGRLRVAPPRPHASSCNCRTGAGRLAAAARASLAPSELHTRHDTGLPRLDARCARPHPTLRPRPRAPAPRRVTEEGTRDGRSAGRTLPPPPGRASPWPRPLRAAGLPRLDARRARPHPTLRPRKKSHGRRHAGRGRALQAAASPRVTHSSTSASSPSMSVLASSLELPRDTLEF